MSSVDSNNLFDRLRRWLQRLLGPAQEEPEPEFDPTDFLIDVFLALRRSGVVLGMGELHAALHMAEEYWDHNDLEELHILTRLVWCHALSEEQLFEDVWATVLRVSRRAESCDPDPSERSGDLRSQPTPDPDDAPLDGPSTDTPPQPPPAQPSRWETLPFLVPFTPVRIDDRFELGSSWPISRRQMVYAWRYLRRPLADGPQDILDIEATIAQTTQQGLFLGPVYRRRERNHAHVLLLIDQNGSMVPFHRFTRDLAETARYESSIEQVDVYYFHNVPVESVYADLHMTEPINLDGILAQCTPDTSVLVASDAGAARGYRRLERIRATTAFLRMLERHTPLLAWLNPVPEVRWAGSSAQVIANLIHGHMFQMDPDGFSKAIDVVRGQPFRHDR